MRIAIVGAGISGLGAAPRWRVTLTSRCTSEGRLGSHTNTVDVTLDHISHPVDTGFLVFNERTYPNLIRLFDELAIPTAKSDMSFAVSVALASGRRLEWAGTNLDATFAQRRNLVSPRFISMLADIVRFNRQATRIALGEPLSEPLSLGAFLDAMATVPRSASGTCCRWRRRSGRAQSTRCWPTRSPPSSASATTTGCCR
jgi:predicted NAD/FAD-binding protein